MLYVSVKWSKLHGLNLSRSRGVIGRMDDMTVRCLQASVLPVFMERRRDRRSAQRVKPIFPFAKTLTNQMQEMPIRRCFKCEVDVDVEKDEVEVEDRLTDASRSLPQP